MRYNRFLESVLKFRKKNCNFLEEIRTLQDLHK